LLAARIRGWLDGMRLALQLLRGDQNIRSAPAEHHRESLDDSPCLYLPGKIEENAPRKVTDISSKRANRMNAESRLETGRHSRSGAPAQNFQNKESEQSEGEQSGGQQPTGEQLECARQQSAGERPVNEQSMGKQLGGEQPLSKQSQGEQSSGEQLASEQSRAEQPEGEQSASEQPGNHWLTGEQPGSEQSLSESTSQWLKDILPETSNGWWDIRAKGERFTINFRWRDPDLQVLTLLRLVKGEIQALKQRGPGNARNRIREQITANLYSFLRDPAKRDKALVAAEKFGIDLISPTS